MHLSSHLHGHRHTSQHVSHHMLSCMPGCFSQHPRELVENVPVENVPAMIVCSAKEQVK